MSPPYQQLICDDNPFGLEPPECGMVCGTKPRHCSLDTTILRIPKTPGPQYTILNSSVVVYGAGNRVYKLGSCIGIPKDTKIVYDGSSGVPLLQFKGPSLTWLKSKFNMRAGDDPKKPIIAVCNMKVGGNLVKLSVDFEDRILSGIRHQMYLKGSRWTRNFDVLLGDKRHGRKVAKIFQPGWRVNGANHKDHYHVHIAPGVDMTIIIAMVFAVEMYLGAW